MIRWNTAVQKLLQWMMQGPRIHGHQIGLFPAYLILAMGNYKYFKRQTQRKN